MLPSNHVLHLTALRVANCAALAFPRRWRGSAAGEYGR